jgi:hypothetical protein
MTAVSLKYQPSVEEQARSASLASVFLLVAFAQARCAMRPFRHWLLERMLPDALCRNIIALPIPAAEFQETYGKRDSHNDLRRFFSPEMQARYAPMKDIAQAFQNPEVTRSIETLCGISLAGSYLRIEYCQDKDGFWLEPHMDIKEKHITIQLYLNTGEDAANLGTDLYEDDKRHYGSAPSTINQGMIFLPKEPNSWHGFEKRPIRTVRRSLIINYVTNEWRARHELSFPQQPVGS